MVFGSTMIEVAIGVAFVYLLVSLLCSALNELIEAWLKYRARYLERGIRKLLSDPGLAESFFNHPLVRPLGEKPSYIPARTFSLALWNIATSAESKASGVTQNLSQIRAFLQTLPDESYGNIKTALLTLIDEAGDDINKARANVEAWYDDAMDRVSGWYKRRTHIILIIMGLVAAFVLNIDTIQITKALLYNDTLRESVADAAQKYVNENPAPTPAPAAAPAPTQPPAGGAAAAAPTATPDPAAAEAASQDAAEEQSRLAKAKINQVRGELDSLGLPIGWPFEPKETDDKYTAISDVKERKAQYAKDLDAYKTDPRRWPSGFYGGMLKIIGLILTGLAVSQGAPFWFDLLNKFMVIRSTVKPREKSRPEGSKDKKAAAGEDEGEGDNARNNPQD
jgi:hypothetical protein